MTPELAAALGLPNASPELLLRLRQGLGQVEELLRQVVDLDDPFLSEASGHLLAAGGKRFRPMLTLLAAEVGATAAGRSVTEVDEQVIMAAAGVELTHVASLYHDDVMDEAALRRSVPSANARYGNSTAILIGDLLFGKASELIADLGPEAVRLQATTFVRLCRGQINDDRPAPPDSDKIAYYYRVLEDKTGSLIATAARYGAMLAGAPAGVVDTLAAYGERLGVGFQLADDLIDITATSGQMGKTPGTDLREGVDTLAVLYAKSGTDPAEADLRAALDADMSDDDAVDQALALLRTSESLARAQREALAVGEEAERLLASLPECDARTALAGLAYTVVHRGR